MKKAILIVSFGTTYTETRKKNITAIKEQVRCLYPDVLIEEAVSSATVRAIMKEREHIEAKSIEEAILYLKKQGVTHLVVFPTHVIDGIENNAMKQKALEHQSLFEKMEIADALLTSDEDYIKIAKALWESLKDCVGDAPLILMGHGTEHESDISYTLMEHVLQEYASHPIYIATVEGKRTIFDVIGQMKSQDILNGRVVLAPFMLVAGDHANNDMAGDTDSFASVLREAGYAPECILRGLGEYSAIRQIYLEHLHKEAVKLEETTDNSVGILYGIGVGTGNPKQMTLQELETIRECDLIVIPAVSKEECYAYQIVKKVYPEIENKPVVGVQFPMIRDENKLEIAHNQIYGMIEDNLRIGKKVGMLTIGDPTIYSTYMYMHKRASERGFSAQIISGVPSFCAVAARLGISLGERDEQIHIIPSAYDVSDTFEYDGTCVYMKSGKKLNELLEAIRLRQKETGEIYDISGVSNCGMEDEHVYHGLDELDMAKGYLTTVIVKKK